MSGGGNSLRQFIEELSLNIVRYKDYYNLFSVPDGVSAEDI